MKDTNSLVCIANIQTNEVLRIPYNKAMDEFVMKKDSMWKFTTKKIYQRYVDSKVEGSKITAPVFIRPVMVLENGVEQEKLEVVNVFLGHPSYRRNKDKQSDNKKGKHYYQTVKENTITTSKGEQEVKHARTIKHVINK